MILAHNYQVPEVQDVADYVGDSLGLSRKAAAAEGEVIVFCGVHFMAETASILCPEKTVLIPDLDAGCSLADSIDAEQLADWKAQYPQGVVVMYVNTTAEVKALTDYCCTSANAVDVVRHIYETHGEDTEILFGPDMWLGAYVEKELGRRMHVWDGECHVHAGIRPADIEATRAAHPDADFLIHPECGCTTSIMEYVASGDVSAEGVHMLSTGGMLKYAEALERVAGGAAEHASGVAESGGPWRRRGGGARSGQASRGGGRDRDRDAPPAADGGPRCELHPSEPGRELQVHEDDHAPEAAGRAARDEVRGARARGDRRARRESRSTGWSRWARTPRPCAGPRRRRRDCRPRPRRPRGPPRR